ncbi:hypothetical protein, partial [Enterococcus faecium]|uniref:hypothetical protein n=1 Tax=Enterococcus faecium TaxID=1352 RepID=UPI0034E95E26
SPQKSVISSALKLEIKIAVDVRVAQVTLFRLVPRRQGLLLRLALSRKIGPLQVPFWPVLDLHLSSP